MEKVKKDSIKLIELWHDITEINEKISFGINHIIELEAKGLRLATVTNKNYELNNTYNHGSFIALCIANYQFLKDTYLLAVVNPDYTKLSDDQMLFVLNYLSK